MTDKARKDEAGFEGHTAGPWHVHWDDEFPRVLRQVWSHRPDGAPDALVARTCFAPASDANARLIAAAPDLLAQVIRLTAENESLRERIEELER